MAIYGSDYGVDIPDPEEPIIDPSWTGIDESGIDIGVPFNIDPSTTAVKNSDGTYTMTNTETGEKSIITQAQLASMQNPQTSGNASMANLTNAQYQAKLQDPTFVNSINKALGTNFSAADLLKIGAAGIGGIAGAMGAGNATTKPTGYQGGIPNLTASQPMLTSPPMGRRPGSGGINYGTGVQYRDKNGNIVSDTSTPVEVLDAAARGNGFNQPGTYGQGTTGAGGGIGGGTSNAGILELLRRLGVAVPAGGNTSGGIANAGGGGGTSIGGGGSGVITNVGGAQAPAATNLADLKASYDTLSKSGGKQADLNAWIRAQMGAGMSAKDFASITGYPIGDIQKAMDAAKNEGRTSGPDTRTGLVAGPGGDNRPTVDYGLKSQGYSRDYSPTDIQNIRGTWIQSKGDPKATAAIMSKYGVTAKDIALIMGEDPAAITRYFMNGGVEATNPILSQTPANDQQKQYLAWQGEQVNPVTGKKIKEEWAARGITDPTKDPSLVAGANQAIINAGNREALGVSSATTRPWSSTVVSTGTQAPAPKTATDWANSPEGKAAGGLPAMYTNIKSFLATNPSQADITAMMQKYGVDPATLQAAKDYNPAVVVGGGNVAPPVAAAPKTAAEWAYTPEGQKAGGIASVYGSINTYLGTNPNQSDLQNMMQTYGVTPAILQAAKDYNPTEFVSVPRPNEFIDIDRGGPVIPPTLAPPPNEFTDVGREGPVIPPTPAPDYFQQIYGRAATPEEAQWASGQDAGTIQNTLTSSLADWQSSHPMAMGGLITRHAKGGLTNLDHGGFVIPADVVSHFGNGSSSAGLELLAQNMGATPIRGQGDGMSDSIPAAIDGREKALVANDEAYLSPQMVERLGDGDMDAGSKKLARMMEQIRKARTGSKEQGKQIDPNKFMPGGIVGYAQGGGIKSYAGTTDPTASLVQAGVTGTEQNLSNWVGPYATQMLGQTAALANTPYQAYTGPLTAGASDLQTQAFNTAANLPGSDMATGFAQQAGASTYTPQSTNFGVAQAQQYMNPYLQASLDPQLAEARRQSDITNQTNNAAMTKAGAFGGGRQAIMTSENQRNLGTNLANITGQGYNTAYTNAMGQFNADQNRQMGENQFGANFGLQGLQAGISGLNTANQMGINNLNTQAGLGATQRGIESEGMAADKAQFEEARKDPYTKLQFQQSMLNGLPITATNYNMSTPSTFTAAAGGATTLTQLLKNLGIGT